MIEFDAELYKELQEDDRFIMFIKRVDELGGELVVSKTKEDTGQRSNCYQHPIYNERGGIYIILRMPKFKELYKGFAYSIIASQNDLSLRLKNKEEKYKELTVEEENYRIESGIVAFLRGKGHERTNAIYAHEARIKKIELYKDDINTINKMLYNSWYDKAVNEYELCKIEVINTIENMLNEYLSCKRPVTNIKFT